MTIFFHQGAKKLIWLHSIHITDYLTRHSEDQILLRSKYYSFHLYCTAHPIRILEPPDCKPPGIGGLDVSIFKCSCFSMVHYSLEWSGKTFIPLRTIRFSPQKRQVLLGFLGQAAGTKFFFFLARRGLLLQYVTSSHRGLGDGGQQCCDFALLEWRVKLHFPQSTLNSRKRSERLEINDVMFYRKENVLVVLQFFIEENINSLNLSR